MVQCISGGTSGVVTKVVGAKDKDLPGLQVRISHDTVWLNRQQLAILFDRDVKTIGKHINNALKEELSELATIAKFATVQVEGSRIVNRTMEYYNLDMVLSVGYRVKSDRGIKYRRWANRVLISAEKMYRPLFTLST
jgi:hypothetical protein